MGCICNTWQDGCSLKSTDDKIVHCVYEDDPDPSYGCCDYESDYYCSECGCDLNIKECECDE